jgi:hypothetical protein
MIWQRVSWPTQGECKSKLAFDLAGLMFNSYYVVGMRTAQLMMGTAAASEVSRMYAEKGAALLEAQAAAGMALATGRSAHVVAGRALSPYGKRARANRRRLARLRKL